MTPRTIAIAAALVGVMLAGCGSHEPAKKPVPKKGAPATPATTSGEAPPDTPPPPVATQTQKPDEPAPGDCGEDCAAPTAIDLFEGIGPAQIGMTTAALTAALGAPDDTSKQGAITTFAYGSTTAPSLRIQVRGGTVVAAWTTNPGDATPQGITVGSTKKAVLAAYPASCSIVGENLACRWNQEESPRWMEFTVDAVTGKVIGIGVGEGDGT